MIKAILLFLLLLSGAARAEDRVLVVSDDTHDPVTLDPVQEFMEKNHTLVQQMFDPLVRIDPEGRIEPALAVSWRRLDAERVRFKLREGVRFHDGEPFDAASVKFTLERYLDPKGVFPARGFLAPILRAEIVDPLTVDIVTDGPDGMILRRLASIVLMLPPKAYSEEGFAGFSKKPVGTGAFRFVEWRHGDRVVMTANRDYWMKGYPKADGLEFRFIPLGHEAAELLSGRVDIVTEMAGTATAEVSASTTAVVLKKKMFYTLASAFNIERGPAKDKRVRLALNYATDREALVRYDLMGNGVPVGGFAMEGEFGYDPKTPPWPYDPVKARKLLADAGYAKGLTIHAFVKESGSRAAGILKEQWKRVGVDLEYTVGNETAMVTKGYKDPPLDLEFAGCPDPMAHVFFLASITLFSQSPYSLSKNAEFDRRLAEMSAAIDEEEQGRLARGLERYVRDEALGLFTYQKIRTIGVRRGVSFNPAVTGMPYFFSATPAGR